MIIHSRAIIPTIAIPMDIKRFTPNTRKKIWWIEYPRKKMMLTNCSLFSIDPVRIAAIWIRTATTNVKMPIAATTNGISMKKIHLANSSIIADNPRMPMIARAIYSKQPILRSGLDSSSRLLWGSVGLLKMKFWPQWAHLTGSPWCRCEVSIPEPQLGQITGIRVGCSAMLSPLMERFGLVYYTIRLLYLPKRT